METILNAPGDMPYWLEFTLYLLAANVVVLTLAHLLSEYGPLVNLIFALVAGVFSQIQLKENSIQSQV